MGLIVVETIMSNKNVVTEVLYVGLKVEDMVPSFILKGALKYWKDAWWIL